MQPQPQGRAAFLAIQTCRLGSGGIGNDMHINQHIAIFFYPQKSCAGRHDKGNHAWDKRLHEKIILPLKKPDIDVTSGLRQEVLMT